MKARVVALAASLVLVATTSLAGPGAEDYARAKAAEASLDLRAAAAAYREALAKDPSAGFALAARARLADLEAHAEGDYAPLAKLEAVRRDAAKGRDPDALDALARDADTFPEGPVRREARLLVAEAFVRRLAMPARGLDASKKLLDDPGADKVQRAAALEIHVEALLALGRRDEASAVAKQHVAASPRPWQKLHREDVRAAASRVARVALGGALLTPLVAAALRRKLTLAKGALRGMLVSLTIAGGALLALAYDETMSPRPFFALAVGTFVLDRGVAVLRGAGGPRSLALAVGLAGLAAVSWLALSLNGGQYLEGFGL